MAGQVKLGMAQLLVEGGEPRRNLERAQRMIAQAAQQGCQIVLLPETMDLGWTHPSAKDEAQPIPGAYSDSLGEAARRHGVMVCAGLTEQALDGVYNSAVLIDSDGTLLLKYRKINVLRVGHEFYGIGQSLQVVDTRHGKIGLNICADNYADALPIGHALARMGAQIILSPSSWTVGFDVIEGQDPYQEKWIAPYTALASAYGLVIVGTTSVGYIVGGPYEGKKMVGCSLAVGRQGILARGQFNEFAGELIVADIPIPERKEKGTAIGEMLLQKGYRF